MKLQSIKIDNQTYLSNGDISNAVLCLSDIEAGTVMDSEEVELVWQYEYSDGAWEDCVDLEQANDLKVRRNKVIRPTYRLKVPTKSNQQGGEAEEAAKEWCKDKYGEPPFNWDAFIAGAQWQKQRDQELIHALKILMFDFESIVKDVHKQPSIIIAKDAIAKAL